MGEVTARFNGQVFRKRTGRPYQFVLVAKGYCGESLDERWDSYRDIAWCLRPQQAEKRRRRRVKEGYLDVHIVPVEIS